MTLEKSTILIVDDEIQNIRVLSEFLKMNFASLQPPMERNHFSEQTRYRSLMQYCSIL
jgi:CheY-like chemotaxis protein